MEKKEDKQDADFLEQIQTDKNVVAARLKHGKPDTAEFNKMLDEYNDYEAAEALALDERNAKIRAHEARLARDAYEKVVIMPEMTKLRERECARDYLTNHMKEDIEDQSKYPMEDERKKVAKDAWKNFLNSNEAGEILNEEATKQYKNGLVQEDIAFQAKYSDSVKTRRGDVADKALKTVLEKLDKDLKDKE